MDQQNVQILLIVMMVFVIVAAIALVFQAAMLYGVRKSALAMEQRVATLTPKVLALAESSQAAIDEARTGVAEIMERTKDILDTTRRQLTRVEDVLEDAANRARVQFDRAEMVVDDAMDRAQETIAVVHDGIMKPIREINGVAAGLRAAVHYFMRGGRPNPDQVTADEEMFI
jgi:signal transduction histidine kinase